MTTAESTSALPHLPPSVVLMQMIGGTQISHMIGVAAQLGIADLLANGPKSIADLAAATGTHAPSLFRLLRGLASLGIFAEDDQGNFMLTSLAQPLQSGVPGSLHAFALFNVSEAVVRPWIELAYSVRTGEAARRHIFGMSTWEYLAQHPDLDAIYNAAVSELSFHDNAAVLAAYDFAGIHTLVEVGGGQGTLMASLLAAYPSRRGVLMDQAHVLPGTRTVLEAAGLADRCELIAGNFFESVPPAGDAYLLKRVIHDWDDAQAVAILAKCHQAMAQQGKLLVIESIIPPGNTPHPGKLMDLIMLVALGGKERTEAEYRTLLDQAGFAVTSITPTRTGQSVIEAAPVQRPYQRHSF